MNGAELTTADRDALDLTAGVLVTFKRRWSGQVHRIGFDLGDANVGEILRAAWNFDSSILGVEPLKSPAPAEGEAI